MQKIKNKRKFRVVILNLKLIKIIIEIVNKKLIKLGVMRLIWAKKACNKNKEMNNCKESKGSLI